MSTNGQVIQVQGVVEESLPGLLFRVRLQNGGEVLAHLAGRLKLNRIRVIPGDRVNMEMASLEDRRGRIVRRL